MNLQEEIKKRRTLAIISHPDAGKTTLTEKFLLYGGAVQLAGSVTARKRQRSTTSDWMELERKRGISISSTVLQFDYRGYKINLLDTPGHKDFSEDTYRVLTAVDSVIMVIDAAKGIESQTQKLFEVCRRRGVPIFTFMNKMDRPTRDPLALLDEIENVLQLEVFPMNWPLGTGDRFRGVFDRMGGKLHLFERLTGGGSYRAPVSVADITDPQIKEHVDPELHQQIVDELDLISTAGSQLDMADVLRGGTTPVFFGSALNNFGVQLLLDHFLDYAAEPQSRKSGETVVPVDSPTFSGFIFKIQANMDPHHRDRIAFVRVCSGKFERDMAVFHSQTKQKLRLTNARRLFGQERETVEEACAGDILGLVGHDDFGIGDTLTTELGVVYDEIPVFTPECFAFLNNPVPSNFKKFRKGVDQLLQEGVVQELLLEQGTQNRRLLAAVGPLQFEVVQYRLETEYGAPTRVEPAPWQVMRWMSGPVDPEKMPTGCMLAQDKAGRPVVLFPTDWTLRFFQEKNPTVELLAWPGAGGR